MKPIRCARSGSAACTGLLAGALAALALSACATLGSDERPLSERGGQDLGELGAPLAGTVGGLVLLSDIRMLKPEYLAGMLVAYAFHDPFAPTWRVQLRQSGRDRVELDLQMRTLVTGGEGEGRQVFARNARRLVQDGGYAGFDVLRYEEGMEATRPFARRVASGEIRLLRSRHFPAL